LSQGADALKSKLSGRKVEMKIILEVRYRGFWRGLGLPKWANRWVWQSPNRGVQVRALGWNLHLYQWWKDNRMRFDAKRDLP